jgi:Ribonuclease G/E
MLAADEVHTSRILARAAALPKPPVLKRYEKRCPKCQAVQHVRRRTCECGHVLN